MIPGITFGSSKGMKTKVVKVTLSDEPDKARGKDPITHSEIHDELASNTHFIGKGLDEIRDLKPCDILQEMNLGSHIVFKQSNDSIAVRDKSGHCKFYTHVNNKWINRFNHKEEL